MVVAKAPTFPPVEIGVPPLCHAILLLLASKFCIIEGARDEHGDIAKRPRPRPQPPVPTPAIPADRLLEVIDGGVHPKILTAGDPYSLRVSSFGSSFGFGVPIPIG